MDRLPITDSPAHEDFGTPPDTLSPDAAPADDQGDSAQRRCAPIPNTGRRAAARLRLTLPARLITLGGTQDCILINISRTGAQVVLIDPLPVLEAAQLKCATLDAFVLVNRERHRMNGLEFDEPLGKDCILELRSAFDALNRTDREKAARVARDLICR